MNSFWDTVTDLLESGSNAYATATGRRLATPDGGTKTTTAKPGFPVWGWIAAGVALLVVILVATRK